MRRSGIGFAVAALAASLAIAGCGSDDDAGPEVRNVEVENFTYRPARIEVKAGDTVVWRNLDKAKHTATAKEGSGSQFDTGTLRKGAASQRVSFTEKGTFTYICSFHAFMDGTVEVK